MPRMDGAQWVGENGSLPMARYDVVCIHTIVGRAPAHAAHFSTDCDGGIFQSRDTKFRSIANLEGNHRVIAIENADMPPKWDTNDGHCVPDFTDEQVEAIAKIIVWCNKTHGIPIVPCVDSRPHSRGIAYHRQGVDGNFGSYAYPGRVMGGEHWSKSRGKVCPGDRRIKTLLERIIPRAVQLSQPQPPKKEVVEVFSSPSVVIDGDGRRHTFECGTDGKLWQHIEGDKWYAFNGKSLHPDGSVIRPDSALAPGSSPSATLRGKRMDVSVTGNDGEGGNYSLSFDFVSGRWGTAWKKNGGNADSIKVIVE